MPIFGKITTKTSARRKLYINQTHEDTISNFSPFRNGQN